MYWNWTDYSHRTAILYQLFTTVFTVTNYHSLKRFCHVARTDLAEDHSYALKASLNLPANWRQRRGRPRLTWQQTINDDLSHRHLGLHSAYHQTQDRPAGCQSTRHMTNSSHGQLVKKSTRHTTDSSNGQVIKLYKSSRHRVKSTYSQLVADIVTKHCIFIITPTSTLQA